MLFRQIFCALLCFLKSEEQLILTKDANVVLFFYFRYVSSNDLKKALAMLGFKASKAVLGNMISRYTSMNIFLVLQNFIYFSSDLK